MSTEVARVTVAYAEAVVDKIAVDEDAARVTVAYAEVVVDKIAVDEDAARVTVAYAEVVVARTLRILAPVGIATASGLAPTLIMPRSLALNEVDPPSACPTAEVTLTGGGFGATQATYNSTLTLVDSDSTIWSMTVYTWSNLEIVALIPEDAAPGAATITVATDGGTDSIAFNVLDCTPPAVTAPGPRLVSRLGSILGCGHPSAFLTLVGGGERVAELNLNSLSYNRRLSEISDARIELSADQSDRCMSRLATLEAWDYEVSIYRDQTLVWCGPVIEPTYTYEGMSISARDLFEWFERRYHPTNRTLNADLSTIASTYMSDALAPDPSPNINFVINASGVTGIRTISALQFPRVADSVRELSRTGVDFYTIARTVTLTPERTDSPIISLTEDIFEVDSARLVGLESANEVVVLGAQPSGITTPLFGHAGGISTPLVQQTFSDPSILDIPSATAQAENRWALLNHAPTYVSGRLLENAAISFDDLIPGVRMRLRQRIGFRVFDIVLRLVTVDVNASAGPAGDTEQITLTLIPPSSRLVT